MRNLLPEKLRFAHNFMLFLHDVLVETIRWGEKSKIFETQVDLKSKKHASELKKLAPGALYEWLEKRGYDDVLRDIIYRNCCLALLSDFCHFVYEALSCSRKKKLAVAYALFRKPFKDNLFYFEWMVADREGFLDCFLLGDPGKLEPNRIQGQVRIAMIQKVINSLPLGALYDANTLYDLRFNKAAPEGLELFWNQATHLITTAKHIQSEPQNFNFVFQEDGRDEGLWEHLYSRLPYVMSYAVDVIEAAIGHFSLLRATEEDVLGLSLRRAAGCMLWIDSNESNGKGSGARSLAKALRQVFGRKCHKCKAKLTFDDALLRAFYEHGAFICPKCTKSRK